MQIATTHVDKKHVHAHSGLATRHNPVSQSMRRIGLFVSHTGMSHQQQKTETYSDQMRRSRRVDSEFCAHLKWISADEKNIERHTTAPHVTHPAVICLLSLQNLGRYIRRRADGRLGLAVQEAAYACACVCVCVCVCVCTAAAAAAEHSKRRLGFLWCPSRLAHEIRIQCEHRNTRHPAIPSSLKRIHCNSRISVSVSSLSPHSLPSVRGHTLPKRRAIRNSIHAHTHTHIYIYI